MVNPNRQGLETFLMDELNREMEEEQKYNVMVSSADKTNIQQTNQPEQNLLESPPKEEFKFTIDEDDDDQAEAEESGV